MAEYIVEPKSRQDIRDLTLILDSRITTLAFRNPAITIATFGEQAMD